MIKVTRLNDSEYWINPHQIEFMESTPDTVISLVSGRKVVIKDDAEKVVKLIIKYRNKLNYNTRQE